MNQKEASRTDFTIPRAVRFPIWLDNYLKERANQELLSVSDIIRQIIKKDYEEKKSLKEQDGL